MAVLPRFLSKFKAKPKTVEQQLAELDQLSMEEQRSLSGNSMHVGQLGHWLMYISMVQ